MTEDVKLLIPLDGSKLAEQALAYVPALMALGVSSVHVVSVLDPDLVRPRSGREDDARERHLLEVYHRELADALRESTGLSVQTSILDGQAAAAVLAEADATEHCYLVLSTHGASGATRWRLGSVADQIVRGAHCPTLVVGPRAAEADAHFSQLIMPSIRSILVPLDGSPLAEQALSLAKPLAESFGATLHLVTVASVGALGLEAVWAGVSPELDEELSGEAEAYLQKLSADTEGLDSARLAVRFGSPAEALATYVSENEIDLVVMTSHGRGGLVRTALGSTTDRMIGGSAPVLVVRAQE